VTERILPGFAALVILLVVPALGVDYPVVDTHQDSCFDTIRVIQPPQPGEPFFGQDAQLAGNQPRYQDNGDGTVTDLNTGLMWVQERGVMTSVDSAISGAANCRIGGYSDWRMPTIKELYPLIDFRGYVQTNPTNSTPYIDTAYFEFVYGDTNVGRLIDCQDWSATRYVGLTMVADTTYFGVNFADGRIKGYGTIFPPGSGQHKQLYHRYVRGNPGYGVNDFADSGDSTVTDRATGLQWSRFDSRAGMNWQQALAWVETKNAAGYCGHDDWRLPNAKELQSIVDYTRAPAATNPAQRGPVIDTSVFGISAITNERGDTDYPWFWTGTTHLDGPVGAQYTVAAYICFGRATGWMQLPGHSYYSLLDVHGAGAQRSDPKRGRVTDYYIGLDSLGDSVYGRGPQGDGIRIENYVRLVRDAETGIDEGHGSTPVKSGAAATVQSSAVFRSRTIVHYYLPASAQVRLSVYGRAGNKIRCLLDGWQPAGARTVEWDGTDQRGERSGSGVYFYRLESGGAGAVGCVTLVR
jgi:hypothetical protein